MDSSPKSTLPTLDKLSVPASALADLPAVGGATTVIVQEWFSSFAKCLEAGDIDGILSHYLDEQLVEGKGGGIPIWWRDMLALTWDMRTFRGASSIKRFLSDRLKQAEVSGMLLDEPSVLLERPYEDLVWIRAFFVFQVGDWGSASGICRLVPTKAQGTEIVWKAVVVFTNLEGLVNYPEKIGSLREQLPLHGKWEEKRRRETAFEDREPQVIVVGGGQSGLDIAARLKHLDVPTLVVEKADRIGDQWRNRYEALCLHDIVWYDHMPYMPFPPNWPIYTPAPKLADWLESYAHAMELDVWTSTEITSLDQDEKTNKWTAHVKRKDGTQRTFVVDHVVFALGFGGKPRMPTIPGMDVFKGQLLHSTQHKRALDHAGKKVVVVGACTSSHDIASDYSEHGVDVTLYQRSSTYIMTVKEGMPRALGLYWGGKLPTGAADRLNAAYPNYLLKDISVRITADIAKADSKLLDGLRERGFNLNFGVDGSGFLFNVYERAGGYYLDVGASQMIVDGKIKLKSGSQISRLEERKIIFDDGSELEADVMVFATGFQPPRTVVTGLLKPEAQAKVEQIWGLNEEGEIRGAWREVGLPGLWYMMGNLALCRFHSMHLALQILAQQKGLFGTRYSAGH